MLIPDSMLKAWVFANTRQQVEGVKDLLSDSLLKIWVFANRLIPDSVLKTWVFVKVQGF